MKKKIQTEIHAMTIMPDGRPFFAWCNELEMLRKQEDELSSAKRRLLEKMQLLGVAEIESQHEPWTGDIVVRFRMVDAVRSTRSGVPETYVREGV